MFDNGAEIRELQTEHLEAEIERLAAGIAATTARWILLVGQYDARDGWWSWAGVKSSAHWVSWRCSVTMRAAREHVRVARALRELPKTTAAFAAGELSYSKVRALSRVATPECEEDLLEIAEHATAAQLERIMAGYRRVSLREANQIYDESFLSCFWEADGSLRVSGSLPPEEGALFLRALEAARDELFQQARAEREATQKSDENGSAEPPARHERDESVPRIRSVDALSTVAESFLATGPLERRAGERYQLILHSRADGRFHLGDGPALPEETAKRLGCDASVVSLTERDGEPLSVGRRTRSVSAALRRALEARDGGCRFPGCNSRRYLDAHHIRHWAEGGETSKSNLLLLCRRHHRLVHEGAYILGINEREAIEVRTPAGRLLEGSPKLRFDPSFRAPEAGPLRVGSGENMDLGWAVEGVISVVERARGPG
jgi:uncharacterized protein DUF222/HNH endonuclease